jgi:hypothetical protein
MHFTQREQAVQDGGIPRKQAAQIAQKKFGIHALGKAWLIAVGTIWFKPFLFVIA